MASPPVHSTSMCLSDPKLLASAGRHLLTRVTHPIPWLAVHIQLPGGLALGGQVDGLWFVCFQAGHRGQLHGHAAYVGQVSQ